MTGRRPAHKQMKPQLQETTDDPAHSSPARRTAAGCRGASAHPRPTPTASGTRPIRRTCRMTSTSRNTSRSCSSSTNASRQFRERVAYVSVGANLTYGELGRKAHRVRRVSAKHRREARRARRDHAAEYVPVSGVAVRRAEGGRVVVNVNPLYTVRELAHQLKDSGAQTIIVFENFAKTRRRRAAGHQGAERRS